MSKKETYIYASIANILAWVIFIATGMRVSFATGFALAIFILMYVLIEKEFKNTTPVIIEKEPEVSLEDLFGIVEACDITDLPDPNIVLTSNTLRLDAQQTLENIGEKIVTFYQSRGLPMVYSGGQAGPKVNLLKFKETPEKGLKANDVRKHVTDLARTISTSNYAIRAEDITFVDIIPGETSLGFYVPSTQSNIVRLSNLVSDNKFTKYIDKNTLKFGNTCLLNSVPFLLGSSGQSGDVLFIDSVTDPHLLLGGATGAGKSVSINALISTLLMFHTPQSLHLYLGDPKIVELQAYKDLPHVKQLTHTPQDIVNMMEDLVANMQERYTAIAVKGVKDIYSYNKKVKKPEDFLPYIVVLIDEFADIMTSDQTLVSTFTNNIQKITQMARAAGIYIILATQRPSVNVIPGDIKANLANRVAFRCASGTDSSVIIDNPQAATLLGKGDGLFKGSHGVQRFQGVFIDDTEANKILKFWNNP